ncbi:hypothetical protein ABTZ46_18120 [Nocardioides sp. NPDC126508]
MSAGQRGRAVTAALLLASASLAAGAAGFDAVPASLRVSLVLIAALATGTAGSVSVSGSGQVFKKKHAISIIG